MHDNIPINISIVVVLRHVTLRSSFSAWLTTVFPMAGIPIINSTIPLHISAGPGSETREPGKNLAVRPGAVIERCLAGRSFSY